MSLKILLLLLNDAELWKSRGEADWAHQNNKPMSDWYAHDQLINGKRYHYNRLGYFDKTGVAADVVAQDCYSPSLDISLSESNAKTKAIYDYVEDMRLHHSQGEEGVFVKTDGVYDQTVNHGYNTFEVWGQRFKTIIADGDISIYSNMIPADPKQPMAIISLHGNVKLWVDSPVKAVVYAPNGEINFEGIKTNGQTEYSFEGIISPINGMILILVQLILANRIAAPARGKAIAGRRVSPE